MAERGDTICLLGRNPSDLERSAADLQIRGAGNRVLFEECDLEKPDEFTSVIDAARKSMGGLDAVVVTAGLFAKQEDLEADPALADRLLRVNFTNTVLFCEAAKNALLREGGGTLCVFSSVAGERGRKPVIIYGAAKAGLSRYLEGLDHKHHADGLRVVTVKPGFVKTSMTAGLDPPPFAGEPDDVPAPWQLIMAIIRALPRAIMRRLSF
jgi:NAD(P)-dependent dehydrogenase (short-subunit alcohol dehydrogenase family)